MKKKHTEGPWMVAANPLQVLDYNHGKGPWRLIACVNCKPHIDGSGDHTIPCEEAEANARAIANVPGIIVALRNISARAYEAQGEWAEVVDDLVPGNLVAYRDIQEEADKVLYLLGDFEDDD